MPKQEQKTDFLNDEIKIIDLTNDVGDISLKIINQMNDTYMLNSSYLQQIQQEIYFFTAKHDNKTTTLYIKKISDRIQYTILPSINDNHCFIKISSINLKNQCHQFASIDKSLAQALYQHPQQVHACFYINKTLVEKRVAEALPADIIIKETLSNNTIILSNNTYNYPLSLTRLPAVSIWKNQALSKIFVQELELLQHKFSLLPALFSAIKRVFTSCQWTLDNGEMRYNEGGLIRSFDYASCLDDIIAARFKEHIEEYLSYFRISDLNSSSSFPTVSIRSLVHERARPNSLSSLHTGYTVAAAKEHQGKQTPVDALGKNSPKAFSLWLTRAHRHLCRHSYRLRVIFPSKDVNNTFSVVGEQASTIALFPALIKGLFESLNLDTPSNVRLIAHNEDVLTIASETASWVDINAVNQKAGTVFKMVCHDGADPLSLFEQMLLPMVGVGNFQIKIVPPSFFDLIETAYTMKPSMPPGHDHYLLGLAYECLHEWALAVSEFQKALRFDASDPDILQCLGSALMEIQRHDEALPFLKRAFELLPEDPEVANICGRSHLKCGRIDDAIMAFEQAVKLSPATADYLKNLGDSYLLAERTIDALQMFNKAVRCDPCFAEAHASLAELLLDSGDEALAKKHALLAYKEDPVNANIANLLFRLTIGKK